MKSRALVFLITVWTVFLFLINNSFSNGQVIINEVCNYSGSLVIDEDGDAQDWIEIFNGNNFNVNLRNYFIERNNLRWTFPEVIIPAQGFMLIYASEKNRTGAYLHTNFKLSKEGVMLSLYNGTGILENEINVPALQLDHSFGPVNDGDVNLKGIFSIPSPGSSNNNQASYTSYCTAPEFSQEPGFYKNPVSLEISGSNDIIRYTTDGSDPDQGSLQFVSPLTFATTTVIKTRSFDNGNSRLPSKIITATFFINYEQHLPVFSISTNPDNLFNWNTGIYVNGPNASPVYPYFGANFWQDWEIPANIEFYETDGRRIFSRVAGVKINGGTSNRSKPMKSLRLSNKSEYGGGTFEHRFFEEKEISSFKVIVLRNSSGDFNKTHFRDGCLHQLLIGKTNIDVSAYRPAAVFLNGEYFGVHNIRERASRHYLEENFDVDDDNIDLLEEDSTVIEGSFNDFNAMYNYIMSENLNDNSRFSNVSRLIDTKSLCDYYIAETFLSNIDWPYNNIKFWRERKEGSKWRYILIDLDIALGNNGWAPASFDILGRIMGPYGDNNRHVHIFRKLLENTSFREYFINRYADLVNTLFTAQNMERHVLDTRERLKDEMPLHFSRWGNDMTGWDQEIFNVAIPHIYDRPAYAMEQVKNVFNLEEIVPVTFDVWPPGAGTVQVNTIIANPLPWTGNYFDGNPITAEVIPGKGFKFVTWHSDEIVIGNPANPSFRNNIPVPAKFTAIFNNSGKQDEIYLFPNPATEFVNISWFSDKTGTTSIEVSDVSGKIILEKNIHIEKTGMNKYFLKTSTLTAGIYMINIIAPGDFFTGKLAVTNR